MASKEARKAAIKKAAAMVSAANEGRGCAFLKRASVDSKVKPK